MTSRTALAHSASRTLGLSTGLGDSCALSPDGKWFVNGFREGKENYYVIIRREDGFFAKIAYRFRL